VLSPTVVVTVTLEEALFMVGVAFATVVVALIPVKASFIFVHVLVSALSDLGKLGIVPDGAPPLLLKSSLKSFFRFFFILVGLS
jgi:hypothetical protein